MTIKTLSQTPIDTIIDCFLLAFEDYYVELPKDKAYYKQRWESANVDFSLSYGMFDDKRLVGFILHAIDTRFGVLTAYNTGTGVIPEYRGKDIVRSIYTFALKDLKKAGIKKSTLEVITKNERAIHVYKSVGFKMSKVYKCFNGCLNINTENAYNLKQIDLQDIDWQSLPNLPYYSWDNQKETLLKNANCKFYYVLNHGNIESYFIHYNESNCIAQCGVLNHESIGWERLFYAISNTVENRIKMNNVDSRWKDKLEFLDKIGLNNVVDQYEMELYL